MAACIVLGIICSGLGILLFIKNQEGRDLCRWEHLPLYLHRLLGCWWVYILNTYGIVVRLVKTNGSIFGEE